MLYRVRWILHILLNFTYIADIKRKARHFLHTMNDAGVGDNPIRKVVTTSTILKEFSLSLETERNFRG